MTGVLQGVRVLDFGRFIAAPYCGMLLGDMGADVIRVERPGGEDDRRLGLRAANGENLTFPGLARNKRAITLDLLRREARPVLADLVARADVVLHNFSPPAAAALGLAYEAVRAVKPDVIYTAVSCYGADGPSAHRSGFDPIAQVSSGAAAVTGFEGQPPLRAGVPWVDYGTGLAAAFGTMVALRHRDATGEGQAVDCALLQTAVSYTAPMIAEATVAGRERPRLGNRAAYLGPSDLYRCRDGYVYVATATESMWRSLVKVIGHAELECAELATDAQRFEHRGRVDPIVEGWMAERTVTDVVAAMDDARIPCGVYHTTAEVPDDPQVRARRMLEYVDLEVPGLAAVPVTGVPVSLSRTPGRIVTRPPRVGEHNDDIYPGWLAYTPARVRELRAQGAI